MTDRKPSCGDCRHFCHLYRAVITPRDIDGGECALHEFIVDELQTCDDHERNTK